MARTTGPITSVTSVAPFFGDRPSQTIATPPDPLSQIYERPYDYIS